MNLFRQSDLPRPEAGRPPDVATLETSLRAALVAWLVAGSVIVASVFVALGGWAFTAPIAQAVIADGTVKVDSNRKRVQHLEGGTVSEILVRDGDRVRMGDVLVRLDETRAKASLGIVQASFDAELARLARLRSERDGFSSVAFPAELAERSSEQDVAEMLSLQTQLFHARRKALESNVEILTRQISQLEDKQSGFDAQLASLDLQTDLVEEELQSLKGLFGKGYVDKSRLLALEKESARIAGERGELTSEVAETGNAISGKKQEILQIRYDFNQSVVDELREAQTMLLDLKERLDAARHVVENIEIRAPVDGIVVGLAVFSEGEVIKAGDVVLELVPSNEALTIEARVQLMDIDNLTIGQEADVRFTAFDSRNTPVLQGRVAYISADALEDERTGQGYFRVKVDVSTVQVEKLGEQKLQPGMPADVIIRTGERTVLQYLYQPISNALAKAWTEQ